MTNAEWWARVREGREQSTAEHHHEHAGTLTKGQHTAGLEVRQVGTIGTEIVLLVDGELVKSRLYRSHEQAELSNAIAATRESFQWRGWE
jgi:hypothetical protein